MMTRTISRMMLTLAAALALAAAPLMSGCENLPGSRTEQSTVIGGAGGAAVGAILAKENRLLGALIGGALGAGAGYLIGAKTDWFEGDDDDARDEAAEAAQNAQTNPATAEQARRANSADINDDGFVTMDEIIAMEKANLTDRQMIDRLEAADQVYDLNEEQRQYLLDRGVSQNVVNRMLTINREERDRILSSRSDNVVGRPDSTDLD
jgi:hypothetical protein